ncbi:diphthine synthase [Candidatus Woesearchaeota archaeon]|jgi:diphthine synthase|nr:diphthine synthase [Candidatus Woesearchaeota archaeon]MBT4368036.1 diphthine synthase [Candidatus Woesearchaeota archaeon]MBT4712524.1 diphthine synthase [Candidatus Woesearchaeota archaeon]MBT6639437.1 diphthine synthase [Candidatus Woesearchaeota archaeon]MBT7133609.1 diphthine synthase [Candidatus Woesearchaeota archaeon]
MLNIIGIGLKDEKSITLEGLELIKDSDVLYLETYTSKLTNATITDLEKFYKKKIIKADREVVEKQAETTILKDAKTKKVSFLVMGDPFSATTHMDLLQRAREKKIKVNIINNVSILNAIGIVGLELYKYGKTTSIPFDNENVTSPLDVYEKNKEIGLHTLFLLDLRPEENKYMSCKEATDYLIRCGLNKTTLVISCAQIGSNNPVIRTSKVKDVKLINKYPQCLIIPGNLHFVEEELISQ